MALTKTAEAMLQLAEDIHAALPHAATAVAHRPGGCHVFVAVVPVNGGCLRVAMDNRATDVSVEFYPRETDAGPLVKADRRVGQWYGTPDAAMNLGAQSGVRRALKHANVELPYYSTGEQRLAAVRTILMNAEIVTGNGLDERLNRGSEDFIRLRRALEAKQQELERIGDAIETRRLNLRRVAEACGSMVQK